MRHALPRQAALPRERLTPLQQLGRALSGMPLLPLPSGQGNLLLCLVAPEASRTSISPRSAPTRKKKSKIFFAVLEVLQFCCFVLYLICFTLNPFLFRMLAQRAVKRAKVPVIVIEDEPTATAGGMSETTLPDPARIPHSNPQHSPQRKYMVYFLLSGAHG